MNQVFLEYLEEAYQKELRNDQFKLYIKNLVELLLENGFTHEEVLEEMPSSVSDYFENEFQRCAACNEWTRQSDLVQARFDSLQTVCPSCREDGC